MKTLLALCLVLLPALPARSQTGGFTVQDVADYAYSPRRVSITPHPLDEEHYLAPSADGRRLLTFSFKTGKEDGVVVDLDDAKGEVKPKSVASYIFSPTGEYILFATETEQVYRHTFYANWLLYDVRNKRFSPLSDGGKQMSPLFSPDGNVIAFAREGNLFLVKLLFGAAESQVTKDGEYNAVSNGIPDWVNEEEFTTARSFCFTADSRTLVWVRYDETRVPLYHITEYKGLEPALDENDEYPGDFSYKYPVAGAENSAVSVLAFDIKDRTTRQMDLPLAADGYVPRIYTSPRQDEVIIATMPRLQNELNIYTCNVRSRQCSLCVHETSEQYIKETTYEGLRVVGDHLVLLSQRDGHQHLYLYSLTGTLVRQLTAGDFEVTRFYGCDNATKPADGRFYFQATDGPLRRNICCVDKNGKLRTLAGEQGTNSATFSTGAMRWFLLDHSSEATPDVFTLCQSSDGRNLVTLEDNSALRARWQPLAAPSEFFTFTTDEGVSLNGYMVRPKQFDATRRYPVVMYQYGGPGSQEVADKWGIGFAGGHVLESLLAQEGFIAVIVDGRGTGFRGEAFEKSTYMHLGVQESRDQVAAARWLAAQPYVDATRIGIWGWSFGGFNTLMAMSDGSGAFRAGVAVAAPTNWKYYDSVYTERYMRTPQENAAGYADNPITRAPSLRGSLLLVHGTSDDNVHYRNFAEISEAYVQSGIQFQQQVYTNRNHFLFGGETRRHLFTRLLNFFKTELGE